LYPSKFAKGSAGPVDAAFKLYAAVRLRLTKTSREFETDSGTKHEGRRTFSRRLQRTIADPRRLFSPQMDVRRSNLCKGTQALYIEDFSECRAKLAEEQQIGIYRMISETKEDKRFEVEQMILSGIACAMLSEEVGNIMAALKC
jgi:hypothetical protein